MRLYGGKDGRPNIGHSLIAYLLPVLVIFVASSCSGPSKRLPAYRHKHNHAATTSTSSSRRNKGQSGISINESAQWPVQGNNAFGDRYSPDVQLSASQVGSLVPAFTVNLPGSGGEEDYPIESGGVLYVTTTGDRVMALNAVTGKQLWAYTPSITSEPWWAIGVSRGITLGDGHVYLLTANDYLTALDETSGKVAFSVQVASPSKGYSETSPPLLAGNIVVVGSAGGDQGVRGFVAGYGASTGNKLWQFYTVPAPGTGWNSSPGSHGGGAVWTTPVWDPSTGIIYVPTGNPSPDYYGEVRPGPDPYTDSVIALSAATGKLIWASQEVPHDLWDYDVASPPILFARNGQLVVGEAGKDGEWYEWNAATGNQILAPVPFVKIDHSPPTPQGTEEWPGSEGGANYGPSAYDPSTGYVYVTGINGPQILYSGPQPHSPGGEDLGTRQGTPAGATYTGTVTAINTVTGNIAWQVNTASPAIGGITATAGGIVLFGTEHGVLRALSASTGRVLWQVKSGAPIGSAPSIYDLNGSTYVVVVTGGADSLIYQFPSNAPYQVLAWRLPRP
jgi:PQQ-dependent dehydrogenase (methanol/ethanol family)